MKFSRKNICFIANYDKTKFYLALGKALEAKGHQCFFIATGRNSIKYFKEKPEFKSRVLDLSKFYYLWRSKRYFNRKKFQELQEAEEKFEISIDSIILMDRLLSKKPSDYAYQYFSVIFHEIKIFFIQNKVDVIFQEATWAHEILVTQIAKILSIPQYCPHASRVENYFLFFKGFEQKLYFKGALDAGLVGNAKMKAVKYLTEFREKAIKPIYFYTNVSTVSPFKTIEIFKFIKHAFRVVLYKGDETSFSLYSLVKKRLLQWPRAKYYQKKCISNIDLDNERYVFFPLHVQPEASVDVLAPYNSNQYEVIKALTRLLPSTVKVYVKEHSNFIGSKSIAFYKALSRLPGIVLISPHEDSHKLIKHSICNISITGTVAMESGFYGKKTICLEKMYFSSLIDLSGIGLNSIEDRKLIQDLIIRTQSGILESRRLEFLTDVFLHGGYGDVSLDDSSQNINNVFPSFIQVIEN